MQLSSLLLEKNELSSTEVEETKFGSIKIHVKGVIREYSHLSIKALSHEARCDAHWMRIRSESN